MITKFKLFEYADDISMPIIYDNYIEGTKNYKGPVLTWETPGSYPFAFDIYSGNISDWWEGYESNMHGYNGQPNVIGRVWTNEKIISFWHYPPEQYAKKCFKYIESKFLLNFDDDWRIEIRYPSTTNKYAKEFELIPLNDYVKSEDSTDTGQYINHLDLKKNKKVLGNYGSKKDFKYKIAGEPIIQAKQRLKNYYQENKQ